MMVSPSLVRSNTSDVLRVTSRTPIVTVVMPRCYNINGPLLVMLDDDCGAYPGAMSFPATCWLAAQAAICARDE
jgi:hypothetical protein